MSQPLLLRSINALTDTLRADIKKIHTSRPRLPLNIQRRIEVFVTDCTATNQTDDDEFLKLPDFRIMKVREPKISLWSNSSAFSPYVENSYLRNHFESILPCDFGRFEKWFALSVKLRISSLMRSEELSFKHVWQKLGSSTPSKRFFNVIVNHAFFLRSCFKNALPHNFERKALSLPSQHKAQSLLAIRKTVRGFFDSWDYYNSRLMNQ